MTMSLLRKAQFRLYRYAEPRAIFEWQSFFLLRKLLKKLPKGDGHPVLVLPGFGGSDRSTRPLRGLLEDLGYQAYGWGLGVNILFDEDLENEMVAMVEDIAHKTGQKVSIIGWSLGGIFAREVAKSCPDSVRCVITLGSPISGDMNKHTHASKLFELFNGKPNAQQKARTFEMSTPPSVPTTSIYSKTDGIVAWEGSVQKQYEQTENIELAASHLGIGVNPLTMYVIADRLQQQEGQWKPFKRNCLEKIFFQQPAKKLLK